MRAEANSGELRQRDDGVSGLPSASPPLDPAGVDGGADLLHSGVATAAPTDPIVVVVLFPSSLDGSAVGSAKPERMTVGRCAVGSPVARRQQRRNPDWA